MSGKKSYEEIKDLVFNYLKIPQNGVYPQNLASQNSELELKSEKISGEDLIYILKEIGSFYASATKNREQELLKKMDKKSNKISDLEKRLSEIRKLTYSNIELKN